MPVSNLDLYRQVHAQVHMHAYSTHRKGKRKGETEGGWVGMKSGKNLLKTLNYRQKLNVKGKSVEESSEGQPRGSKRARTSKVN